MNRLIFFPLFLMFFSFGCSGGRLQPSSGPSSQNSATKTFREVYCALVFRQFMQQSSLSDKEFYISCDENDLYPLSPSHPLPYPSITATIHLPQLKENCKYVLYCPFTGCPQSPEVFLEWQTDDEGNPIPVEIFKAFQEHHVRLLIPCWTVSLYANPGYCSDWYLFSIAPFSVLHTSFTYKPITASLPDGKRLTISKKEPGGNLLEVSLRNFSPSKRLLLTSCSAGEELTKVIDTKEDGTYDFIWAPQVLGYKKGVDHIAVSCDDELLEASVEWDMSTMDIKRVQSPTYLWKLILALKDRLEINSVDVAGMKKAVADEYEEQHLAVETNRVH